MFPLLFRKCHLNGEINETKYSNRLKIHNTVEDGRRDKDENKFSTMATRIEHSTLSLFI